MGAVAADAVAPSSRRAVVLEGFDIEQVERLQAGVALRFSVYGTPQARVALRIEGSQRLLDLHETEPGIYEGTYVLSPGDAVRADSGVVATLRRDGDVARLALAEPLVLARDAPPWLAQTAPLPLPRPDGQTPRPVPPLAVARAQGLDGPAREGCRDCALVESIQAVVRPPPKRLLDAIAGAVAGLVRNGRPTAWRSSSAQEYDVVLRRPDGSVLLRRYEQLPLFKVGDTLGLSGPPAPAP